jgi:hypothetical protein
MLKSSVSESPPLSATPEIPAYSDRGPADMVRVEVLQKD